MGQRSQGDRFEPGAFLWGFVACLVAAWSPAAIGQTLYRFTEPGTWVEIAEPPVPRTDRADGRSESAAVVLFDRQINVTATGDEYYQHLVTQVLNADGVAEYSQIDLVVDPTFQALDIHWLRVVRDGVVIDQRPGVRITELAQETDLRSRIYNGRYTVNVLLTDVRAGDMVEYAYTLRSREELYPGHFYTRLDLGWSQRVEWQRVRVRAPRERSLTFRASDGARLPEPVERGGARELVLESRNLPAIPAEFGMPGWHSPWPYLEVGDLGGWNEVVDLVVPLYRGEGGADAAVGKVAADIRAAGGTAEQRLMRALQFVQEEIRYTSIAIGRGSHAPSQPGVVLERRFGDCKDKSLLLSAILNELGIAAAPALVHTWRGRALDQTLPTPYAFDHAIVRAELDGRVYWLDPTRATQYGELSADRSVDFERALVLGRGVRELEGMARLGSAARRKEVAVVVDVRKGIEAPATLTITSRYRGGLAESVRSSLSARTPEQLQTDFTTYAARYYPTAKPLEPFSYSDDRSGNVVEVRERYALDQAFQTNGEGVLELALHADELYSYAEALGAAARQAPLALEYPIQIRQEVVARLPESWPVEPRVVSVDNPVFNYRGEVRYASNTVTLNYEYESRADHILATEIPRFEADRARMYDDLGYVLTFNPALASAIPTAVAPLPMLLVVFTLLGSGWVAVRFGLRYDPKPDVVDANAPVGIRGWLLLPAIGAITSPFVVGWVALQWLPFMGSAQWDVLPALVDEGYRSSAQAVAVVVMCGTTALAVGHVLAAWLFFTKRTSAPGFYVGFSWLSTLFFIGVVVWAMGSGLDGETRPTEVVTEAVRDVFGLMIWTAYMWTSRRVRATFVRRWREASPTVVAPEPASG